MSKKKKQKPEGESVQVTGKMIHYKDLLVGAGSELYTVIKEEKWDVVEKLYKEGQKAWKDYYGDWDPAVINNQIQEYHKQLCQEHQLTN